jgi:hypothetical protein
MKAVAAVAIEAAQIREKRAGLTPSARARVQCLREGGGTPLFLLREGSLPYGRDYRLGDYGGFPEGVEPDRRGRRASWFAPTKITSPRFLRP